MCVPFLKYILTSYFYVREPCLTVFACLNFETIRALIAVCTLVYLNIFLALYIQIVYVHGPIFHDVNTKWKCSLMWLSESIPSETRPSVELPSKLMPSEANTCGIEYLQNWIPAELNALQREYLQNRIPADLNTCKIEHLQTRIPAESDTYRIENLQI